MKRKRSKSVKAIAMSLTAQALIDMAMAVETGDQRSMTKARDALHRLNIQIYVGEPIPELAPCDIKLATIPQLIYQIKKQCTGFVACALKVGANGEEWYDELVGSPDMLCTCFNRLGRTLQNHNKTGGESHESTATRHS